jgi:hypothetical protein
MFFFICLVSVYAITEGMILFPWSGLLLILIFIARGSGQPPLRGPHDILDRKSEIIG